MGAPATAPPEDDGQPAFMRYTRPDSAPPSPGTQDFAQPSYLREQATRTRRSGDVPWEHMSTHGGFFMATLKTIKQVLLQPTEFFRNMPVTGGLSKPLGFAMLLGFINVLFSMVYQYLFMGMGMEEMPSGFSNIFGGMMLGFIIAAPLLVAIGLFINAFFYNLALRVFKASPNGFEGTFRVMAYIGASSIFNIIPMVGQIIGGVWGIVIFFKGIKHGQETTYGKVLLASLLLLAALFLVVMIPLFLLGFGAAMLTGS